MKKKNFALGVASLLGAILLSFGTSISKANTYWTNRTGTAPNYSPAGIQIIDPGAECNGSGLCGFEWDNQGRYVGTIPGHYDGE